MPGVQGSIRDAVAVIVDGLRIIGRHWPVLAVIFLAGQAVRNASLWAAVVVSDIHPTAGAFLLPLAPLATLTSIILMLRSVAPSLRHTGMDDSAPPGGPLGGLLRQRLALLASALVPFLTVYAAQGFLREDTRKFVNEATADEWLNTDFILGGGQVDFTRVLIADEGWLLVIIAGALAVRFLIDKLELPSRGLGWGLFAAFVEVTWVTLLARAFTARIDSVVEWVQHRAFVAWWYDLWERVLGWLGPVAPAVEAVRSWFWEVVVNLDVLVVIPLAWLTVAAIVYGRDLPEPMPSASAESGKPGEAGEGAESAAPPLGWFARTVPRALRRLVAEFGTDLRERFGGFVRGLRQLARAGLVPMLLFCLVFLSARGVQVVVYDALRAVIGPRRVADLSAFTPYIDLVGRTVFFVVIAALLAAAVDRVLGHAEQPTPAPAATPVG